MIDRGQQNITLQDWSPFVKNEIIAKNGNETNHADNFLQTYKKTLEEEHFQLAMTLSPGVKLQALLASEPRTIEDRVYAKCRPIPNQYCSDEKDKTKPRDLPSNKNYSVQSQQDAQKLDQPWVAVYNLLEMKRKMYHEKWHSEIQKQADISRTKREIFDKRQEMKKIAEVPCRQKKPISMLNSSAPLKIKMNPPKTCSSQISLPIKKTPDSMQKRLVKVKEKRVDLSLLKLSDLVEFKNFSNDNDIHIQQENFVSKSKERQKRRAKIILQMSETIIANKVGRIYPKGVDSTLDSSTETFDEKRKSSRDIIDSEELERLSMHIKMNSRRISSFSENFEAQSEKISKSDPDIIIENDMAINHNYTQYSSMIYNPTQNVSFSEPKVGLPGEPVLPPNKPQMLPDSVESSRPQSVVSPVCTPLIPQNFVTFSGIQNSPQGIVFRTRSPPREVILEPLSLTELLSNSSVKVKICNEPKPKYWKII